MNHISLSMLVMFGQFLLQCCWITGVYICLAHCYSRALPKDLVGHGSDFELFNQTIIFDYSITKKKIYFYDLHQSLSSIKKANINKSLKYMSKYAHLKINKTFIAYEIAYM